ncbi:MAG: hypothetical protein RLZZ488_2175 [Pseudomonadota bacterium]|jgi:hypothetical protein
MSTAIYREDDQNITRHSHFLLRAALIFLSTPVVLFALSWLNFGAALLLTILVVYTLVTSWTHAGQPIPLFRSAAEIFEKHSPAFAVLLIWCALSGTGGIGFQNSDYAASNALLKDLIENRWPLYLRPDVPLVYYVLYYLPAAGIGKILGWQAANVFLFVWTYAGLIIVWSLFSLAARLDSLSQTRKLLAVLLFIIFGGWDFFGSLLNYPQGTLQIGSHIEWWAAIGQFSSNTTLLFWVPQHVLAPWMVTAAILLTLRNGAGGTFIWFMAAMSFLWSPVASLGLLPFLFICQIRLMADRNFMVNITAANFFVGPMLAAAAFLFYSSNSFSFPSGWQFGEPAFARNYTLLILLEALAVAFPFFSQHLRAKIYLNQIDIPPPIKLNRTEKTLGWSALAMLMILPAYKVGIMNDLCMRASVPALMILFFFWIRILRKEFTFQYIPLAVTFIAAILGSGSAFQEVQRSLSNYSARIVPMEKVSTLLNNPDNSVIEQRAGKAESLFWKWLGPQRDK